MTIHRTDIEKALDEMISNEEGMTFQGLAVVLAKQRWPELIASERHNDHGLDAYAPASPAPDRIGKGLACSLTAKLGKVRGDIRTFRKHVNDVGILLFATPKTVTRQTADSWKKAIWKEFSIELQVLPREDIITALLLPNNASICQSHLKLQGPIEPTLEEWIRKTQEAAAEVVSAWVASLRLAEKPKIALQSVELDGAGHETREVLSLERLHQALSQSRRIVLEAPAGRGKTTTLVQLAERHRDRGELAFLVSLPSWVKSNKGILEFITGTPAFQSRGINAAALSKIHQAMPYSFLLNGWNEISERYSDEAVHALADLERDYPKAGIIVATRSHHIRPPLQGSLRARLLPLNPRQRAEYLKQIAGSRASGLISQLESDRVLDDLTRTPLILAAITDIYLLGAPIPRTKSGVLGAIMRLVEESSEHRDHLAHPPLRGGSRYYLIDLAVLMTAQGSVMLEEEEARSVVSSVSQRLQVGGQIASLPEPAEILNELCAHHVLERLEYPSAAFRFQHQQFQEWYASQMLRKRLLELVDISDPDTDRSFISQYMNIPGWEEPLRMVAEEIGKPSPDAQKMLQAGKKLVEWGLRVDPVFAAALARLCGHAVWTEVRDAVKGCLQSWYLTGGDSHRECALAGMLVSGSDEFKDILLPLFTSNDQQVRLSTYRSAGELHVSSLGENWNQVVRTWQEDHLADFIGEMMRDPSMAGIAEEFGRTDPSFKVRAASLRELEWVNATEALGRVLASYEESVFEEVLRQRMLNAIPPEIQARALRAYGNLLQKAENPKERLRIRFSIEKIGGERVVEGMKEELAKWPPGKIDDGDEMLVKSAIELIQKNDPDWASHWVAERIVSGSLWYDRWKSFISNIPESFRQDLIKKMEDGSLNQRDSDAIVSVLAATSDVELAGHVFSRLCSLRTEAPIRSPETSEKFWNVARRLQGLFRAMPLSTAVSGMMGRLSSKFKPVEYEIAIELFGPGGVEKSDLKEQLSDELRQTLRRYFKQGIEFALAQDDYHGRLKGDSAIALAKVGDPEDMVDLNRLIRADIERKRRGIEARRKGDLGPAAEGAPMSWSNWHINAVECLDPDNAEGLLVKLLNESEYQEDAAKALIRLARIPSPEDPSSLKRPDYSAIWHARSEQQMVGFSEDRRLRYTGAIKQIISTLMEQRSKSGAPEQLTGRVKSLGRILAILDGRDSADLVTDIMALPGQWDGYARAEALEALLFNGTRLQADAALKVINPTINDNLQSGGFHDQQSNFLLQRCLCLLPFLDPPSAGIARIKEIVSGTQVPIYDLRGIVAALGNSRSDEALNLLVELASKYEGGLRHIMGEWIDAIASLGTTGSKKILLSYVDPDIENFRGGQHLEYHERERLILHIAEAARSEQAIRDRLYQLCGRQLPLAGRNLLAGVMGMLGTTEDLIAGLNLIHDQTNPSIPYGLSHGLENVFLGKRPYGSGGNAYTIEPISANEIRERLFEMVLGDDNRKRSAWELLGQIESWRLKYGRPNGEPRHPAFDSGKLWPPCLKLEIARQ